MMQFRRQIRRGDKNNGNYNRNKNAALNRKELITAKFREFDELVGKKRELNRKLDLLRIEIDLLKDCKK